MSSFEAKSLNLPKSALKEALVPIDLQNDNAGAEKSAGGVVRKQKMPGAVNCERSNSHKAVTSQTSIEASSIAATVSSVTTISSTTSVAPLVSSTWGTTHPLSITLTTTSDSIELCPHNSSTEQWSPAADASSSANSKYKTTRTRNQNKTKNKEMFNPTSAIVTALCSYLLEKTIQLPAAVLPKNAFSFIRVHREKLKTHGEFSFPSSPDLWKNCCKETGYKLREVAFAMFKEGEEDTSNVAKQKFLKAAACWEFPIERLRIDSERCFLYLQRHIAMEILLRDVLKRDTNTRRYGNQKKDPNFCVFLRSTKQTENEDKELSLYRAKLLEDILRRVLEYSKWTVVTEEEAIQAKKDNGVIVLNLAVKSTAFKSLPPPTVIPPSRQSYATIRCGLVIDPLTGKLTTLKTSEYLSCRSNDMCLMAMHKYGVRVKDDSRFNALMTRLGAAAVTVDLMEVRFSSPVQIIRSGKGSTKGAAFILYNSARLESLLRRFDEKVQNGNYRELPSLDNIDLTLLDEEEEWQLVFGYIFAFPNLIESCLEQIEKGICAVHTIVRFLGDLASLFSVYYRRIRILIQETREHLLPCVYARIYLVKAVREILNRTLALLDIEPVQFM